MVGGGGWGVISVINSDDLLSNNQAIRALCVLIPLQV